MKEQFLPYEESLTLKKLGFKEDCLARHRKKQFQFYVAIGPYDYNTRPISETDISAPLYQQAFKWFRDTHKLNGQIAYCEYGIKSENSWSFTLDNPTGEQFWEGKFKSYEAAELSCIRKLIKIVKDDNN